MPRTWLTVSGLVWLTAGSLGWGSFSGVEKARFDQQAGSSQAAQAKSKPASGLGDAQAAYLAGDYATALRVSRALAEQGDPAAQVLLGQLYSEGRAIEKSDEEAVKWYRKAADHGLAEGQGRLGFMYAEGRGVTKDNGEAVKWYRKAAEQGLAKAQYHLGFMYLEGRSVAKDDAEAVKWFRKAAEQGEARAEDHLGYMYAGGRGVTRDDAEAVRWYRKAAEQGLARAQTHLGVRYAYGRGVSKDEAEAMKWFLKAADQGDAVAQANLGYAYLFGRVVPQNDVEAVKWFRMAAEQGLASAQGHVGFMYAKGRGVKKDDVEAVRWFRKAAEHGDARAQRQLGAIYALGQGVGRDDAEALKWLLKAAEHGDAFAQSGVGQIYKEGRGVPQDYAEAVRWYRKAAEQGHPPGQLNLGAMYENGLGVPKDLTEAAKWYRLAAEEGFATAQKYLGDMYASGLGVPKDLSEAARWYRRASEPRDSGASEQLDLQPAPPEPNPTSEQQVSSSESRLVRTLASPFEQTVASQDKSPESPSGTHLTYREASRRASPTGDFVTYVLRADGLPEGKSYSLTGTWMNGKTYKVPETLHLDGSGRILRKDGSQFDLILGGTFAGEFIRFTLLSDDGTAKASAEITPVPIEAVGKGGCRLTVKPLLANGQAFSIIGAGFKPGDEIKTVSTSSGKAMEGRADNKGGNLKIVVFPAVAGQSGGDASVTASDTSCSVTVRYAWGDAMVKLSPAANQAAPGTQAAPAENPGSTEPSAGVRPEAVTTPQLSKGAELLRLAMLTVALDHKIALINVFLPHTRDAIYLGKEKITHENAKDVLEKLRRERSALTDQIDREGFSNFAGDYDWRAGKAQDQCKLRDVPPDASGPVSVAQNGHEVEFKGNGFKGCGVIAGTVVVLRPCEGVSTLRLLTRTDTLKALFFDATDSSVRCDAGHLTKRAVER